MIPEHLRIQCRILRRKGLSLPKIVKITNLPKITTYDQIKDIQLSDKIKAQFIEASTKRIVKFNKQRKGKSNKSFTKPKGWSSELILSQSYQDGGDSTLSFKRVKSITDLEELSVKSRMGIWKASFQSVLKRPILGVGIGNYPMVLDEDISAAKKGASAHNLYLDVASEMGLLGLIVLLLIFWQIFKKGWKTNLIFTFFLLWIFIYSLFDVVLLNDKVLLLFMVILGILYDKNGKE